MNRRVSLINIRAFTRRGRSGVHAWLYDESRHVGKFQRDHRPRVLRQTKGAWPRTVIFCRIYGAPSFTALLQNVARARAASTYVLYTYHRRGNANFLFRVEFVASIIEKPGALSRAKWHTRDLFVVQLYEPFGSLP